MRPAWSHPRSFALFHHFSAAQLGQRLYPSVGVLVATKSNMYQKHRGCDQPRRIRAVCSPVSLFARFHLHIAHRLGSQQVQRLFDMDEFINFSNAIREKWHRWYQKAPASYDHPIFQHAVPAGVLIRYGQNRIIKRGHGDQDTESAFWRREFNLDLIARMEIALATHYRYVLVASPLPTLLT